MRLILELGNCYSIQGKDTPHAEEYDKYTANVNDKRIDENGQSIRFSSKILPPYLRRTKTIEELIPWLYLKGVSTGDFTEALKGLRRIEKSC